DQSLVSSHAVLVQGGSRLKFLNGRSQNAKTDKTKIGSFGDGIYLGMSPDESSAPQDVIVDKWTSTDNGRQAISIIGCLQCRFTNNYFLNTKFPVEGAGMDFEPNPLRTSVSGLALKSGSAEIYSASEAFKDDDVGKKQIQIGNFYSLITGVTGKHEAFMLEPSPITATGPSGTITSSNAS